MITLLQEVSQYYQIVLVSGLEIARIQKVLENFEEVEISATYKLIGRGLTQTNYAQYKDMAWCLNYSRVFKDFKVPEKEVLQCVCVIIPVVAKVKAQ